ncbi:MAG: hypothetical protein CMLOHMNK_01356 [Steroidobacteraceae bacterium]|nr:hypothetical protein [Steroidobacteraceae bacterium]
MEPLDLSGLPEHALLLLDTPPLICWFEAHPELGPRFRPLFEAHRDGGVRFAVTTISLAEVMTGPLQSNDEALARRYRNILESWQIVELDAAIAENAARLRAAARLKLPEAVQAASALAVNADALITHDRDFSRLKSLRVLS